jgi:YHS domain-containing protein
MQSNSLKEKKHPRFVALCGRIFRDTDPAYFPRVEHRGRTIYLCTESCLGAFLADPDVFYKVHRNSQRAAELSKPEACLSADKSIGKT